MSATSPSGRPLPLSTRAKLTAAAAASASAFPALSAVAASLPAPSCSNAHQPAPSRPNLLQPAPAQNEPTTKFLPPDLWQEVLREFQSVQAPAEGTPDPTTPNLLQPAPTCSNAHHDARRRKTNPASHPSSPHLPIPSSRRPLRPLTPTQLRAARLWFDGHPTAAILQTLAISRHTLTRWKRHPDFQLELRRLSDEAIAYDRQREGEAPSEPPVMTGGAASAARNSRFPPGTPARQEPRPPKCNCPGLSDEQSRRNSTVA